MQTPTPVPLAGLANAFLTGFANARIVLPDEPARDEIGAASAVSARLGLNMTGMMLPPVARSSELNAADTRPLILIGPSSRVPASIAARLKTLKDTQGLAAWAEGAVVIAGPNPLGTRVAAEAFAGRSPYLWDGPGQDTDTTFDRVAASLSALLRAAGIEIRGVSFDDMVFERGRDEAISATVTASVPKGAVASGRRAVESLKQRHLRGEALTTLSYSGVGELAIRVTDGQSTETVTVPRVENRLISASFPAKNS